MNNIAPRYFSPCNWVQSHTFDIMLSTFTTLRKFLITFYLLGAASFTCRYRSRYFHRVWWFLSGVRSGCIWVGLAGCGSCGSQKWWCCRRCFLFLGCRGCHWLSNLFVLARMVVQLQNSSRVNDSFIQWLVWCTLLRLVIQSSFLLIELKFFGVYWFTNSPLN